MKYFSFFLLQVNRLGRMRTGPRAAKWSACSFSCSSGGSEGGRGGSPVDRTTGWLTAKQLVATATAACPARALWTWTTTRRFGSRTSKPTWPRSSSWPEGRRKADPDQQGKTADERERKGGRKRGTNRRRKTRSAYWKSRKLFCVSVVKRDLGVRSFSLDKQETHNVRIERETLLLHRKLY